MFIDLLHIFFAVVIVNFSESVNTVDEGDGQVEVCAVLTGQTARDITVTITTQSDTASGIIHGILCLEYIFTE